MLKHVSRWTAHNALLVLSLHLMEGGRYMEATARAIQKLAFSGLRIAYPTSRITYCELDEVNAIAM